MPSEEKAKLRLKARKAREKAKAKARTAKDNHPERAATTEHAAKVGSASTAGSMVT